MESLLNGARHPRVYPLRIDLAGLIENVQGNAKEQVTYFVDMAKSDALEMLGETRKSVELLERHV